MRFVQEFELKLQKPIVIAGMQDMGSVGSIVVDFIRDHLRARRFRTACSSLSGYVVDNGGYIDVVREQWSYAHTDDLIIFGGGSGQPQTPQEMHEVCTDVIAVAKKHSAKLIYAVGGLHTDRDLQGSPRSYVTSTSKKMASQLAGYNFLLTSGRSLITGFNGLILGYAKRNGIRGIGVFGELNDPSAPQYRTAKAVVETLRQLTFQKLGDTSALDRLADDTDGKMSEERGADYRR